VHKKRVYIDAASQVSRVDAFRLNDGKNLLNTFKYGEFTLYSLGIS
jgi:hypothetical protein